MEDTQTHFRSEGEPAFNIEPENATPASPSEETTEETVNPSPEGENTPVEKKVPFHEDPQVQDYINRQLDKRLESERAKIMEEFQSKLPAKAEKEEVNIPSWFGGDKDQWEAYQADQQKIVEKAKAEALANIKAEKDAEIKAKADEEQRIKEATDFMESELEAIQKDPELNPTGEKVDANKLWKIVDTYKLIDDKGRWNYRAAALIYKATNQTPPAPTNKDRKTIASATTSQSKTESKTTSYKTADDFKGKNWKSIIPR